MTTDTTAARTETTVRVYHPKIAGQRRLRLALEARWFTGSTSARVRYYTYGPPSRQRREDALYLRLPEFEARLKTYAADGYTVRRVEEAF